MGIERRSKIRFEKDMAKCISLVEMFAELMNPGCREMPKSQMYHLITALIGLGFWSEETTLLRIYNTHGAIPMVHYFEESKHRRTTLPNAITRFADPRIIKVTKRGNKTYFEVGKLGVYNQAEWTPKEEEIIRKIVNLRKHFGNQTYAILGLSKPSFLENSIRSLEKKAIGKLEGCADAISESRGKSEINRKLKDSSKFLRSALDKIRAYRETLPQIKENIEEKGLDLPIDLHFDDIGIVERDFCLKREIVSELRHIVYYKLGIGRPDHDRSHVGDFAKLQEIDMADFFEDVELALSRNETNFLKKCLEIQVNVASSRFEKSIFGLLLAIFENMRCYDEH